MAQNFGASGSCAVCALCTPLVGIAFLPDIARPAPAALAAPDDDTAFSSPPWPVDFSALVAASVRR
jgi:hypothetical protein